MDNPHKTDPFEELMEIILSIHDFENKELKERLLKWADTRIRATRQKIHVSKPALLMSYAPQGIKAHNHLTAIENVGREAGRNFATVTWYDDKVTNSEVVEALLWSLV